MTKNILPKVITKKRKRLGRGYGSGKGGHTVGRGQKGQKTRDNLGILFEGIKVKKSLIKKLPLARGRGKFTARRKPIIIKLALLNLLPSGAKVDMDSLIGAKIVSEDARELGVKILGDGEVGKKLTVEVPISKNAAKKVIKVGGKVTSLSKPK